MTQLDELVVLRRQLQTHAKGCQNKIERSKVLDDKEKRILILRYGLRIGTTPQTLEQIGERFSMTRERVRQIEYHALKKLENE